MNKLVCEYCGKELSQDDIILLVKTQVQKVVNVATCCRGECHDELEKQKISEGYSCGFYEMNNGLKDLVLQDEFISNLYEPESLEKYKRILQYC